MKAWRIDKDQYISSVPAGEGPRLVGGRWNSPGLPAVYAASHLSLSILEILVHAKTSEQRRVRRSRAELDIPEELIEVLGGGKLPADFSPRTGYGVSQALGDEWLKSQRTPVLVVPSALVPEEQCVLLNPLHSSYAKCRWGGFVSIEIDSRLWAV